jgi:titin
LQIGPPVGSGDEKGGRVTVAIFVVSNLNDSGAGSLRAAITAANADASGTATAINFSVNGTITLASALPAITHATTIDATSAPTHVSI